MGRGAPAGGARVDGARPPAGGLDWDGASGRFDLRVALGGRGWARVRVERG